MGYTWEIYALEPDRLLAELAQPQLDPGSLGVDARSPDQVAVAKAWRELGASVAGQLGRGGGSPSGPESLYLALVLRHLGRPAGSVNHTSSGGEQFREEFIGGQLAATLGDQTASRLYDRPLDGLRFSDRPSFGWLDPQEVAAAAALAEAAEPAQDADEDYWTVIDAVTAAAGLSTGLVTAYL